MTSFKQYALYYGERDFLHAYKGPVPAKPKPHPLPEGIEGIRKIIRYAVGAESKALCAMMGLMGMRVSEARSISPTSFDMHDRVVTIRGKGDRTREVPMSDEAWDAIQDAFFLAIKNGTTLVTLSDSAARRAYATAGRRAGISRRTSSHDARATLATAALNNGANIRVVQEILGHASVASTEVYTGVTEQQMRDGMTFS